MTALKFKVWDKINKRWLNVSSLSLAKDGTVNGVWELRDGENELYGLHQVDIVRFTGLRDKNGKEIYEADIVRIYNYKMKWKRNEPPIDWRVFEVKWNRYVFNFNNDYISTLFGDYDSTDLEPWDLEIISNIYENPELLNP